LKDIDKSKLIENNRITVICEESCQYDVDYSFYGFNIYSEDSSICRSAFYEELIDEDGGMFNIEIVKGLDTYIEGPQRVMKCNPEEKRERTNLAYKLHKMIDN